MIRVQTALQEGNCGQAIQEMEAYLSAWPEQQTADKLQQLKEDYGMMTDYWRQGGKDPDLQTVYQRLLHRMYVLYANVRHYHRMQAASYLHSLYVRVRKEQRDWSLAAIRRDMEGFVSGVAMLQLEPEHKRKSKSDALYKEHQQRMSQLFEYVLTSRQWTAAVGREFSEMMVSPTIDSIDQQLVITSVALSLLNQFDMEKFRMLTDVYQRSQDDQVRQRALVGWVLTMDAQVEKVYPEQRELVHALLQQDGVRQELTELQLQLIYCLNEERDTSTIRQEIMPDLLKNNNFKMTRGGLEEEEDDPMEEILHPDASEQKMEQLEKSFQRMMDMQKQGSDIFFGGFSQMKRFPFFYDISNWLVPFYPQHPDIAQYVTQQEDNRFMDFIMQRSPFCNSDKYSFVIAFQQVVEKIPEHLRQMMKRGELAMDEMGEAPEMSPAYIRRVFLMDLYRFFRLFSHRSELANPFDTSWSETGRCLFFASELLADTPLEGDKAQVVRLLKRMKMNHAAQLLLRTFGQQQRDVQYYLWTENYAEALRLDPENERALVGMARTYYRAKDYEQALKQYDVLTERFPQQSRYHLNHAVCLVQLRRYEEALKELFRLNYEQPDNDSVSRVLAWTLTCEGRLEQASKMYEQLTAAEQPDSEDLLNYGYCLWLQGQIDRAADCFQRHYRQEVEREADFVFSLDEAWLQERHITQPEIKMMISLVN